MMTEEDLETLKTEVRNDYFKSQIEIDKYKKNKRKINLLLILIVIAVIIMILFSLQTQIAKDKAESKKYIDKNFKDYVNKIIINKPKLINYINNKAIIKMEDICNGVYGEKIYCDIFNEQSEHQCLGYIEIYKNNNKYEIDTSHYCDMYQ